eukprot:TRINITY_DN23967_c0_g1_i1.p1 TRINITY_DN23967_c0_g1~~TRINITY_DN23967_c0_g1_i1.p1  ORF type:complete len:666 (+),score=135.99 TRINITY_DN23967_c0_g1_i1:125-1999(+)
MVVAGCFGKLIRASSKPQAFSRVLLTVTGVAFAAATNSSEMSVARATFWDMSCCRFATQFASSDWRDEKIQDSFIANVLAAERNFFAAPNVAYDPETGMTWDGIYLDPVTGQINPGALSNHSAPSKESIQLSLLALSLQSREEAGDRLAALLPLVYGREQALNLLEKKVASLEDFDRRYPAFGGFLPWFCPRGARADGSCRGIAEDAGGIEPATNWQSWQDNLPGLDNGQIAWAVVAVIEVLEARAAEEGAMSRVALLAERYRQRLATMRASVVNMFYNGKGSGTVRAIAQFKNSTIPAAAGPENFVQMAGFVLNDPYEGEMMVLFMDLLGNWSGFEDDGAQEKALIWQKKSRHLKMSHFTMPDGKNISIQQGFWFSSHEQWKTLQLPYLDLPLVKQIFANGELARLHHSLAQEIPGIFASCHAPPGKFCGKDGGYCSAAGIQELANVSVHEAKAVTPYGAFPAMLIDPAAGLAWYNYMLSLPTMQSPAGSLESSAVDGEGVRALLTWDAKETSVLAMLGGTGSLVRRWMDGKNLSDRFNSRVHGMYAAVFDSVGEFDLHGNASIAVTLPLPLEYFPTTHQVHDGSDGAFPSCGCNASIPLVGRLRGTNTKDGEHVRRLRQFFQ